MLMTTDSDEQGMPKTPGAINGGMAKRQAPMSEQPTVTIGVDDIDKALEKVSSARRLGRGREDGQVADMGWAAYFKDSEGNVIGLWQTA